MACFALGSFPSWAADNTYCVAGYSGQPPNVVAHCSAKKIAKLHPKWHRHMWVKRGDVCYVCYDEVDNSCVTDFLVKHRRFKKVWNPYEECPQADTIGDMVAHVINGEDVAPKKKPPPPAPPEPVKLTARLDHVSPGPYAAGDKVSVRASLRDNRGDIRTVPSGVFVIKQADGSTTRVKGKVHDDGTVRASFPLPTSQSVSISFEAGSPKLASHESIARKTSSAQRLSVDVCALRVVTASPARGASLIVGQEVIFEPGWRSRDGTSSAAAPSGAVALTWTLDRGDGEVVRLPSTPDGRLAWTPSDAWRGARVRVKVGGRAGGDALCPGDVTTVTVSELGLGLDTSQLPDTCYANHTCQGTATLVRPTGSARLRVDQLLAEPTTEVRLYDGPDLVWSGPARADDTYTWETTYQDVGHASWRIEVVAAGGTVALPDHDVNIRPPLIVSLPARLDLGEVEAGTPFSATCVPLDFSASKAAQEHGWRLTIRGLDGCEAQPVLGFANALGLADRIALRGDVDIDSLDPDRPILDICLDTSGCASEAGPPSAVLVVTPRTPEFSSQSREVQLTWSVTGRSFWSCHGWWLLPLLVALILAFIVAGFVIPHRFPAHAAVRLASSPGALKRQSAIGLRSLPGSGSGWYRSASLVLMGSGEIQRDGPGALLELRASARGLELVGSGLQQQDRRSRRFQEVDDSATGHVPSAHAVYRVGDVYFKVEA